MALTFDFSACADADAIKADTPDGWPVTDCLIWLCLITGTPKITAQTAEKFWHRVSAWEQATGPLNTSGRRIEPADIQRRIGLRTNASPLTAAAWRKKLADTLQRESAAAWRRTAGGTLRRDQLDAAQ